MYANRCCNFGIWKCEKERSQEDSKVYGPYIPYIWNVKTNVMPVILGTTRNISKSLGKYLNNIPGKQEIKELQ
jgi:hypothetical protein